MKRIFGGVVFCVLAGLALSAPAEGAEIRFTQAASGTISAVLFGSVDPCNGSVIFPLGVSSVVLNGTEYDIDSTFAIMDPPPCPYPPQPYEVTASLGIVADGHHLVVWTVGPMIVQGAFEVRSGVLQSPAIIDVPALTLPALAVLFTLIALVGLARIRRQEWS